MARSRKAAKQDQPRRKPSPEELEKLWERDGAAAIETVRRIDPGAYLAAIARLVRDE
jgi:hypothetical protein